MLTRNDDSKSKISKLKTQGVKKEPGSAKSKSWRIAVVSALVALAMIFSYIEAIIPINVALPGIKLGIANIIIIIALYKLAPIYALGINLIRILLVGLMFTGTFGIIYSLAGGVLSFVVMLIAKKTGIFSVVGVSMAGGVFHNFGQLATAALIVESTSIFVYFPVLIFSGLITGVITGIISAIIIDRTDRVQFK